MQQFIMLGHVQAFLTGLKLLGFKLDTAKTFKRYAIAILGPYLTFSVGFYLCTMSFLFTAWFFVPVAMVECAAALATIMVTVFVNRRLKTAKASLSEGADGRCMTEVKAFVDPAGVVSSIQDSESL